MPASAHTFTLVGVEAMPVQVEAEVTQGLPAFSIVGLPDTAVRESRERVRAALTNAGFEFPMRRIVVSLAPAGLRKAGAGFDLAIAAAILAASAQLRPELLERCAFAGELALDGSVRTVPGALAIAEAARASGMRQVAVPQAIAPHAAWVEEVEVIGLEGLAQLRALSDGEWVPPAVSPPHDAGERAGPDLADLRGQDMLRFALEVAAAGGHHMLLLGPAGAGKSMALRRLPSILPPLEPAESLEVMRIAGAVGRPVHPFTRPFRSPHHTVSHAGLVGGGPVPRPGEVTLAHRGVLFLDELPEFDRACLESLRVPMEDGRVTITRASGSIELPSRFQLVAAANPCPCGRGVEDPRCNCDRPRADRYVSRLSGALADRIDIQLSVRQPPAEELLGPPGEGSAAVRERTVAARERQHARLGPGRCNADMSPEEAREHAGLDPAGRRALAEGQRRLGLSGRGHERMLRVARTIADLSGCDRVGADHIARALSLRARTAGR